MNLIDKVLILVLLVFGGVNCDFATKSKDPCAASFNANFDEKLSAFYPELAGWSLYSFPSMGEMSSDLKSKTEGKGCDELNIQLQFAGDVGIDNGAVVSRIGDLFFEDTLHQKINQIHLFLKTYYPETNHLFLKTQKVNYTLPNASPFQMKLKQSSYGKVFKFVENTQQISFNGSEEKHLRVEIEMENNYKDLDNAILMVKKSYEEEIKKRNISQLKIVTNIITSNYFQLRNGDYIIAKNEYEYIFSKENGTL